MRGCHENAVSTNVQTQQDSIYHNGQKVKLSLSTDKISVKFKAGIDQKDINNFITSEPNLNEIDNNSPASQNLYESRTTENTKLSTIEIANIYYELLPCEWSLPDFYIQISPNKIPNDTYFPYQYYFHNTGQFGGTPDAYIDAPEAWDISKGNSSIVVAVLDEGVSTIPHEDLMNIWSNSDETIGDGNGDGFPGVQNVDDDGDGKIDEDTQGRQPGEQVFLNLSDFRP